MVGSIQGMSGASGYMPKASSTFPRSQRPRWECI
jgi:hypothetical protein